jgi:hypothetical protein
VRGVVGDLAIGEGTSATYQLRGGSQPYDETAPIDGVVRDGAGVDSDEQAGMTQLDANWLSYSDPESGIGSYEYQLARTIDTFYWNAGTSSWAASVTWNNAGLTTSVALTHANLALRTGTDYYFCVRAINNAGIASTGVCSDGLVVLPSATLDLSTALVTLPAMALGGTTDATATMTATVVTNAAQGYVLYASKSAAFANLTNPTATFTDVSGACLTSGSVWPGGGFFGVTSSDTVVGTNKFLSATRYCGLPTTDDPAVSGIAVAERAVTPEVTGGSVTDVHTITYRAAITSTTLAGAYQTEALFALWPRF